MDVFEFVLFHSTHHENPLLTCVNLACREALLSKKKNFVVTLMKHGSTPPPEQLWHVEGLIDEPCVQLYLHTLQSSMMAAVDAEPYQEDELVRVCMHRENCVSLRVGGGLVVGSG